jgi:glycerol-3-phosphate dehydrogenase (NAD(P)+)
VKRIGILGSGSWGTALAVQLAKAGHPVRLWSRRRDLAQRLAAERVNDEYLPGVSIPDGVTVSSQLADLVDCEVVLVVVPSHGYRQVLREFLSVHPGDGPLTVVSATKGIETEDLARMSRVSLEEGQAVSREIRFAVLSGPTFAAELARDVPSAAVIASQHEELAVSLQEALSTRRFRLYRSSDVVGVELGGTAKNVIAIAAGLVSGLGLGHNTLSALITRGLHEITRLGVACGGEVRTFAGLAGLGDLVLTCTGDLSRNRQTGLALAAGKELGEITEATHMVAEGIRNSLAIKRLAGVKQVEMPITEQMEAVVHEGKTPRQAVDELMQRALKVEAEL